MADLATQQILKTGLAPAFAAAAAGGDTCDPDDRTFLYVKNAHTASWTVTVNSIVPCDQGVDHNLVVAVPNGQERVIGPIDKVRFARASDGKAEITYSGVTALTIAVVKA